jgi:hypothetical protein
MSWLPAASSPKIPLTSGLRIHALAKATRTSGPSRPWAALASGRERGQIQAAWKAAKAEVNVTRRRRRPSRAPAKSIHDGASNHGVSAVMATSAVQRSGRTALTMPAPLRVAPRLKPAAVQALKVEPGT